MARMARNETPSEHRLRAQSAVHTSWANTTDPAARTAPARAASLARYERQVDPDGVLPPDERRRRADAARKAFMADMGRKSARARRERGRK